MLIKATGANESFVKQFREVRGSNDDDACGLRETTQITCAKQRNKAQRSASLSIRYLLAILSSYR